MPDTGHNHLTQRARAGFRRVRRSQAMAPGQGQATANSVKGRFCGE